MATKIQKMDGWICSSCRQMISGLETQCPNPNCREDFESGPLSASNKTTNLPQTNVKYYG